MIYIIYIITSIISSMITGFLIADTIRGDNDD